MGPINKALLFFGVSLKIECRKNTIFEGSQFQLTIHNELNCPFIETNTKLNITINYMRITILPLEWVLNSILTKTLYKRVMEFLI